MDSMSLLLAIQSDQAIIHVSKGLKMPGIHSCIPCDQLFSSEATSLSIQWFQLESCLYYVSSNFSFKIHHIANEYELFERRRALSLVLVYF